MDSHIFKGLSKNLLKNAKRLIEKLNSLKIKGRVRSKN